MSEPDDRELWRRHAAGEPEAAAALDRRHRAALVRFAGSYLRDHALAEDVAQEALARLFEEAESPRQPRAWLLRATRNLCLNRRRAAGRRVDDQSWQSGWDPARTRTGPLSRLVRSEDDRQLRELLGRLPEPTSELLRLRYAEGLSRGEIAEVLELSPSVVKSRLFEGMQRLREWAERELD